MAVASAGPYASHCTLIQTDNHGSTSEPMQKVEKKFDHDISVVLVHLGTSKIKFQAQGHGSRSREENVAKVVDVISREGSTVRCCANAI